MAAGAEKLIATVWPFSRMKISNSRSMTANAAAATQVAPALVRRIRWCLACGTPAGGGGSAAGCCWSGGSYAAGGVVMAWSPPSTRRVCSRLLPGGFRFNRVPPGPRLAAAEDGGALVRSEPVVPGVWLSHSPNRDHRHVVLARPEPRHQLLGERLNRHHAGGCGGQPEFLQVVVEGSCW